MRKAFSFYKSHYEQMKLMNDKQKAQLMTAICEVQFFEKNISDIKFSDALLNIVWVGIVHSIETSLKGYVSKQKSLDKEVVMPLEGCQEKDMNPLEQEEEKEEEEEKGKEEGQLVTVKNKPLSVLIEEKISEYDRININAVREWIAHKKYKSIAPVTKLLNMFDGYSYQDQQDMVDKSIMNGWKGIVEPKGGQQQLQHQSFKQQDENREKEKTDNINRLLDAGFDPFSQADWDRLSEYETKLMQEHQGVIDVQPTKRIS